MAVSYNTGAISARASSGVQTVTIPAGVLAGDLMLAAVEVFDNGTGPTVAVTSTGTSFTQLGSQQKGGTASGFSSYGSVWYAVASGTDAGKVITATATTLGTTTFTYVGVVAYSGTGGGAPDVSGGTAAGTSPLTFPSETTTESGDWAVYLAPFGESAGGPFWTGPAGMTQRIEAEASGVALAVWDSNGSVGGAGTVIGGAGKTLSSTAGSIWFTGFTVGIAPAQANTRTAALTVSPSGAAVKAEAHVQAATVTPAFAVAKNEGHLVAATVTPVFAAQAIKNLGKGGTPDRHHRRGSW
jgi:hypothetical protein